MAAAKIKRCREPFATEIDGVTRVIPAGALISTDDPAYSRQTAGHFEDIDDHVAAASSRRAAATGQSPRIEQATADPGQTRTLTSPPPADRQPTPPGPAEPPYDPTGDTVKGVLAYLDGVGDEAEALRVLDAEQASDTPRAGIVGKRDEILARYAS